MIVFVCPPDVRVTNHEGAGVLADGGRYGL